MKLKLIVRRYSEAYVAYVKDTIGLENALEEAKILKRIIGEGPEFMKIMASPAVSVSEKFNFVDEVLKDNFSSQMVLLLKLLIEKRRASILPDLLDYLRINYSHGEAVDALLKSAYPLDIEVVQEIKEKLEKKFEKKLHFYFELDANILGGVEVTVGNTLISGSLKTRLEDLRRQVITTRMV